jgi:hypothetical protein
VRQGEKWRTFFVKEKEPNKMPHSEPCRMCGKIECSCLYGISGVNPVPTPPIRTFETGATRDTDKDKLDYEGFLSPLVLQRFAQYMRKHQVQTDGCIRKSDNWQKGIPKEVYMKSLLRHMMELWLCHRGNITDVSREESLCAILFNAQGYLFEFLKGAQSKQCPQCGGPSTEKDILYYGCCVKCAYEPIGPSPKEKEPGWDQGFWLCGNCGVKNKNSWRVCFNCQKEK